MSFVKYLLLASLCCFAKVCFASNSDNNFATDYKKSCAFLTGNEYGDDWCNLGNSSELSPNVVVIGDSYSNSLTTFFDAIIKEKRANFVYRQFGRGQCPSLIGYGPEYCKKLSEDEYNYIIKTPSIKTVVLAASWEDYYLGKKYAWLNYQATQEQFKSTFLATLNAYKSAGKVVVIIFESPVLGFDPHACFSRGGLTGGNECVNSRSVVDARQTYRQFMIKKLKDMNVYFFDPVTYFCTVDTCIYKNGDKVYTTDGGAHLSVNGGAYLAQRAATPFVKLLKY